MNEFLQPPTKELSNILQSNDIAKPVSAKVPTWFAQLLADITDAEETCLKTIHARYCIPRALPMHITDINRLVPGATTRPNYWEYWYKFGTANQFFLMSREVIINENGMPILDVKFNKVLEREGE